MKKWAAILFLLSTIACSKGTGSSKFAGEWIGTYRSTIINTNPVVSDTGTLRISIGVANNATGTMQSLQGSSPTVMKGTVDPASGAISISKYGKGDFGINVFLAALTGNLSGDAGTGKLAFPWATLSKWSVSKN